MRKVTEFMIDYINVRHTIIEHEFPSGTGADLHTIEDPAYFFLV